MFKFEIKDEESPKFIFRNIGGTSSGAVTATATAAAEFARNDGGLDKVKSLPVFLRDDAPNGSGGTSLGIFYHYLSDVTA